MTARTFVAVPLCDYEPITTKVWNRRATHAIVRACLCSIAHHVRTPIDVCILADRCSDAFVRLAEDALAPFAPATIDNSALGFGLTSVDLPDRFRHIANQFLRTIELAGGHEFLYFCEQDYLFRVDAIAHAEAAFDEVPAVHVLSPFDHPDRHRADREPELGHHRYFETTLSTWKSVSSVNGNWLWRVPFAHRRAGWIEQTLKSGGLDHRISSTLVAEGEVLLSPVRSLIQHYRLDGSNASPTFGFSPRLALTAPIGRLLGRWQRLSPRLAG